MHLLDRPGSTAIQARPASAATILAGAAWAHAGNGWVFSAQNGGWEYPLYLSLLAIVQGLLGGLTVADRHRWLSRAAQLRYGELPKLQRELEEAFTVLSAPSTYQTS